MRKPNVPRDIAAKEEGRTLVRKERKDTGNMVAAPRYI